MTHDQTPAAARPQDDQHRADHEADNSAVSSANSPTVSPAADDDKHGAGNTTATDEAAKASSAGQDETKREKLRHLSRRLNAAIPDMLFRLACAKGDDREVVMSAMWGIACGASEITGRSATEYIPGNMDVTGRDGFMDDKGLAYAIVIIEALPEERQEWSDRTNMLALLTARVGEAERDILLRTARRHIGLETLFLKPDFEASSRRTVIGNLARLLGVTCEVHVTGGPEGLGDEAGQPVPMAACSAGADAGNNGGTVIGGPERPSVKGEDAFLAAASSEERQRYFSARLDAFESGFPIARFVIPVDRQHEAVVIVTAAGGVELPLEHSEYDFITLLRGSAGALLLPPHSDTDYRAVEALLVGRDPNWVARTAHAMPLVGNTKPAILGPIGVQVPRD